MKKAMVTMMLLAGGLFAAPRFGVGVTFRPAPVAVVRPICPGPGYAWVDGYWASGVWVGGYWRPPVVRVAPRPYFHEYERRDGRGYEHFRR
jgi:hypothetical protein